MKVFISHPMNGLSENEVLKIREKATSDILTRYPEAGIIENYIHENVPENAGRLWHLGESIKLLDNADAIYFTGNWKEANGCNVEYLIATKYGIAILNE